MIQVAYRGRIGNQMFQYAFGRILAEELGYRLDAPPIPGFPATYDCVDGKSCDSVSPIAILEFDRPNLAQLLKEPGDKRFLIRAYLQDYKYYAPYLERLGRWFRMEEYDPTPFRTGPEDLLVNIRLGDYLDNRCTLAPDYYLRLIESIPHESLIIVTDSPGSNYLEHFKTYRPRIVHRDPLYDLKWLVNASRLVISQSTFSWWGAILSQAEVWMPETTSSIWSRQLHVDLRVFDNPRWHVIDADTIAAGHPYVAGSETLLSA